MILGMRASAPVFSPAVSQNFLTDTATPAWLDNSGTTGNRMMYDSTGNLTWAPANLLLNSATLSTQSVTTLAQNYILSFKGTGSVTCSGTNATVLAGTGASTRVSAVLVTTAGTLTLTVSGSVTEAQLEPVTYQTQPRAYLPSTTAAVYQPRFDCSPSTLQPLGMLIEESRANLLTYSGQFDNAAWSIGGILAWGSGSTANFATSPDGTTNADKTVEDTSTGLHRLFRAFSATSGSSYAFSVYLKAAGRTTAVLQYGGAGMNSGLATFDLSAGTTSGATGVTASITNAGNGWYRCTIVGTSAATNTGLVYVYLNSAASYTGNGASGVLLWQAQLEAGAFSTSPIPTTSASVTRAADAVKWTSAAFSSYWNASAGTIAIEATTRPVNGLGVGSVPPTIFAATDGTANNYLLADANTTANSRYQAAVGGVVQVSQTSGAWPISTTNRFLVAYQLNNCASSLSGSNALVDTTASIPTVDRVFFGAFSTTQGQWGGYIRSFAYYNQRLPDAILKQKSTVGAVY
jgi:hypothetical protein